MRETNEKDKISFLFAAFAYFAGKNQLKNGLTNRNIKRKSGRSAFIVDCNYVIVGRTQFNRFAAADIIAADVNMCIAASRSQSHGHRLSSSRTQNIIAASITRDSSRNRR